MAVYKVPQDVEAEDKFLGPLTFKQFLFGGGVVITGYLMFLLITKGAGFVAIIILPFFLVFLALAFPWGKDQPTEIWLAGRFRYMFFPRKRIWDQSGVKDLVTINVPKREERVYSDGLEQDEVRSRFDALASVVDSRGWAVKNLATSMQAPDDRLTPGSAIEPPIKDVSFAMSAKDVFDNQKSPLPDQFDSMIKRSEDERRQATLSMVDSALHSQHGVSLPQVPPDSTQNSESGADAWFMNQPNSPIDPGLARLKEAPVSAQHTSPKNAYTIDQDIIGADMEKEAMKSIRKKKAKKSGPSELGNVKTIQPLSGQQSSSSQGSAVTDDSTNATSTTPVDAGILALAHNDDLNVDTIQREANRNKNNQEVVVDLR